MDRLNALQTDEDMLSDVIPDSKQISRRETPEEMDEVDIPVDEGEQGGDADEDQLEESDDDEANEDATLSPSKQKRLDAKKQTQARKQKKRAQDGEFDIRRRELAKAKVADSLKRYSYLLGQTELFQHFVDIKRAADPEYAALLDSQKPKKRGRKPKNPPPQTDTRHRKTEKEEDEQLLKAEVQYDDDDDQPFVFEQSPSYIKGGEMRQYQIQGLNWMVSLHANGLNGILADEMGLGKTLQTISFLGYLKHIKGNVGPHLIVVPKTTLQNWAREFAQWVPDFDIVVLTGTKEERADIIRERLLDSQFEVCITSYEICLIEKWAFKKFSFEYIVIDEAHRIKNVNSILSKIVREFTSRNRMLITGTPLQNNLQELFALLNFICPEIFTDYKDLESFLHKDGRQVKRESDEEEEGSGGEKMERAPSPEMSEEEKSKKVVEALHKILRPFLLRRVKSDVEKNLLPKKEINIYVGLSEMQRRWYRSVLEKDIDAVNGLTGKKEGKARLMNLVMQLRKVTCHPYLFDGAEPGPPYTTDEHLVQNAGKMVILDKLLARMKENGSRVLIFSQMSRMLDILEDYCHFRHFDYCRIDGSTSHEDRISGIDEYNRPGSDKFIFLLTTRAGGLGINLTSADIVVLYDSDWNPQADLQAMDRAHRIGQTKQVYVFRFITEGSVEERMLERAAQKLRLDQLVIQQERNTATKAANKEELLDMIQHGAENIVNSKESMMIDDDIDDIITRGETRTAELSQKYQELNLEDLNNFKSEMTVQKWEGEDFGGKKKSIGLTWIEPAKRERKGGGSALSGYSANKQATMEKAAKAPKMPKDMTIWDHQFYPLAFKSLHEREVAVWKREHGVAAVLREPKGDETPEQLEVQRQVEQQLIDTAQPLTEDEMERKQSMMAQGFENWSRRDYQQFVKGVERVGKDDIEGIAADITEKSVEETKKYADVFWKRWTELEDYARVKERFEEGSAKRDERMRQTEILIAKISSVRFPMQELPINYGTVKQRIYSEEEDRYILCRLAFYGIGSDDVYEKIKRDISEFPQFRFDWFLKSRTPQELHRRGQQLLSLITKEDQREEDDFGDELPRTKKKRTFDQMKEEARPSTPVDGAGGSRAQRATKRSKKA